MFSIRGKKTAAHSRVAKHPQLVIASEEQKSCVGKGSRLYVYVCPLLCGKEVRAQKKPDEFVEQLTDAQTERTDRCGMFSGTKIWFYLCTAKQKRQKFSFLP